MPGISRCISFKKNAWCSSVRWLFWGAVGAWTIQISWTCFVKLDHFPQTKLGWKMTRVWNTNNLVSHKALIRKFNKELFRFILTPYHPYIPPSIELTWVLNKPLEVNLKQRCRAEGLGWLQGWKMHKSPQVVAIYIMQWFFLVNLAWWHKIFQKQTMCVQKQHHPTWPTSPQTKSF